mgnify:CR=1 FL=1
MQRNYVFSCTILRILLISIVIGVLPITTYAEVSVKIYGDDSYAPYSFLGNGKVTGIYSVVLQKIFEEMPGYTVDLAALPWKRGLRLVEDGEIFALYPPYERKIERPYMDYDLAILDEELVVYCNKSVLNKPRSQWPEDYFGLSVGNNAGFSAGGDAFWTAVKKGKINVQETKGTPLIC